MPALNAAHARARARLAANRLLAPAGLSLTTHGREVRRKAQHLELVAQLLGVYGRLVFPELPPLPRRVELLAELVGTEVAEGVHLIGHLHQALQGQGDVCEFGVAQGATSALLANEILNTDRSLWLYDSFEGLPEPAPEDELINDIFGLGSMAAYRGKMVVPEDEVRARLRGVGFSEARTRIIRGFVTRALPAESLPRVVALAYIDFDLYEPILTTLRLLHPLTRPGSVLMVDDYRFFSSGVERAVEEFLAETGESAYACEPGPSDAGHFCVLTRRSS